MNEINNTIYGIIDKSLFTQIRPIVWNSTITPIRESISASIPTNIRLRIGNTISFTIETTILEKYYEPVR